MLLGDQYNNNSVVYRGFREMEMDISILARPTQSKTLVAQWPGMAQLRVPDEGLNVRHVLQVRLIRRRPVQSDSLRIVNQNPI